jgi:AcrR family transcriptional regulator
VTPAKPIPRRRGRPPKSAAAPPAERLLIAAGEACAEFGFERVTLEAIGQRVGMTPAAIYNHFGGKDELLYAAGQRGLEQLTAALVGTELGVRTVHRIAAAFMRPDMATTRRLFLELHLAGDRHPELGAHLDRWHAEWAKVFADLVGSEDRDSGATVKALFLLLLGLCHVDHLSAMPAGRKALTARVDRLVDALYPGGGS